tara:strand:+ start:51467 stop:51628 length:162 start_codon:yes stop_codon:yes gene_type:complete
MRYFKLKHVISCPTKATQEEIEDFEKDLITLSKHYDFTVAGRLVEVDLYGEEL